MRIIPTRIPEVLLVEPNVFSDSRGFFMETFRADQMMAGGVKGGFIQDNHSGSRKNALRGLHYQIRQPQGKLVRVVSGEIYDVAVDLRRTSQHFGRWVSANLSAENKKMLWVPPGFAHGFYVLSEWAEVLYKATEYYAPEWERCIIWNDPSINISWPIPLGTDPALSRKDAAGLKLTEAEVYE